MIYDFDRVINRRGTNSIKWDVPETELPMWVADMDFETAPEIKEALVKRAQHGIFGYAGLPEEWYQAYREWWEKRHHFRMEKDWLMFAASVVGAVSTAVRKLTDPGDHVLVQPPVYNAFFHCIVNNGRNIAESPLIYDGENYRMNFEDLEEKLADPQTTMMILCNPHNPVGKIWDRETLARVGELCHKHHVVVVSDEIHCDLTAPGKGYTPFASASDLCREISVTCIAPTKTFNLAGIQTAAVVAADEVLRHKMWWALHVDEEAEPNVFAVDAAIAAFTKGGAWLDALREYIEENKRCVDTFLQKNLPEIKSVTSDATYLVWLDCRSLQNGGRGLPCGGTRDGSRGAASEGCMQESSQGMDAAGLPKRPDFFRFLRETTGLYLNSGSQYGTGGEEFLRMNLACPRSIVEDGLKRLLEGARAYQRLS